MNDYRMIVYRAVSTRKTLLYAKIGLFFLHHANKRRVKEAKNPIYPSLDEDRYFRELTDR